MPKPNQPNPPDPNNPNPFPRPQPTPAIETKEQLYEQGDERMESVIAKLAVFQELCERAAMMIPTDTRNLQQEKWWEDYNKAMGRQ